VLTAQVIGVGNEYRGDDGVGLVVARGLLALTLPGVTVCEHDGEGLSLLETWQEAKTVILIDAVKSGALPGTILRIEAHLKPVPHQFFSYSSHSFSVAEAIELGRTLERLPAYLVIFAIEGQQFTLGSGLSESVSRAAERAVACVVSELCRF